MLRVVTQGLNTKVDIIEYTFFKSGVESNTIGGITYNNRNIRLGEYESVERARKVFLEMVEAEKQDTIYFMPDKIKRLDLDKPDRYKGHKNKGHGGS